MPLDRYFLRSIGDAFRNKNAEAVSQILNEDFLEACSGEDLGDILFCGVCDGLPQIVQYLAEKNIDPNRWSEAVRSRQYRVLKEIVDTTQDGKDSYRSFEKAYVTNIKTFLDKVTPECKQEIIAYQEYEFFKYSAKRGNYDLAKTLMEGVLPENLADMVRARGCSAARKALSRGHTKVRDLIWNSGVMTEQQEISAVSALNYISLEYRASSFEEVSFILKIAEKGGITELQKAIVGQGYQCGAKFTKVAAEGDARTMKLFIDKAKELDERIGDQGRSNLWNMIFGEKYCAFRGAAEENKAENMAIFLDAAAELNPELPLELIGSKEWSYMKVIAEGHSEVVNSMIMAARVNEDPKAIEEFKKLFLEVLNSGNRDVNRNIIFLGMVYDHPEEHPDLFKGNSLKAIHKLKDLRNSLAQAEILPGRPQPDIQTANHIIQKLLEGDNFLRVKSNADRVFLGMRGAQNDDVLGLHYHMLDEVVEKFSKEPFSFSEQSREKMAQILLNSFGPKILDEVRRKAVKRKADEIDVVNVEEIDAEEKVQESSVALPFTMPSLTAISLETETPPSSTVQSQSSFHIGSDQTVDENAKSSKGR